ncbi:MAG: extracellular solute-binding protein, partial [Firmicutes bacterium]|nr:extracellular solute-binding protein [Bacillota bacterium]
GMPKRDSHGLLGLLLLFLLDRSLLAAARDGQGQDESQNYRQGSKNKEAAWKFVQFLLSDEAQNAMAKTGQMPVTFSAADSDVMKQVGYYGPFVEQLKTALPRTPVPAWNKIDKILNDAFESVFRNKASAKDALGKAAKEIDALLGQ